MKRILLVICALVLTSYEAESCVLRANRLSTRAARIHVRAHAVASAKPVVVAVIPAAPIRAAIVRPFALFSPLSACGKNGCR